jgi:hypothetical protein
MDIIHRLITHKKQDKQIVWGIRVPEKVKTRWLFLSAIMRVPANRLITFVLNDWVQQNADILTDELARNRLADQITDLYLKNRLS